MKHLWFGAGLLALLLAVSLWLGNTLETVHHTPARDLDKAAQAALEGDWPLATALYQRAERHWQKHRNLTAALARHDPIEQIDIGFATLKDYARCADTVSFAAGCSQLAQQLRSLPQSHTSSLWNLL
jgi:hypothetical protein